jgi:hypothetical protein
MHATRESKTRIYSQAELTDLFTTYFGDKLTQAQLGSLVATVMTAHAERATASREATVPHFFGAWYLTLA